MLSKILSRFNRSSQPDDITGPTSVCLNEKSTYIYNGDQAAQSHAQCLTIARGIYSDYQSIYQASAKTPLKKTMAPQPFARYVAQLRSLCKGLADITERYESLPDSVAGDPTLDWQAVAPLFLPFVATLTTGVEQLTDLCSIVADCASDGSGMVTVQGKQLRRYTDMLRILNETDAAIDSEYKKLSGSLGK